MVSTRVLEIGVHVAVTGSPAKRLLPVTMPEVLVTVKELEKSPKMPPRPVAKLPDSVKVPGKGPAAMPLTEKSKRPSLPGPGRYRSPSIR